MTKKKIKELDIVTLTRDIPKYRLKKGMKGTIFDIYRNGLAYEVEFTSKAGHGDTLFTLEREDIE